MRIDLLSNNDPRTQLTSAPRPMWSVGAILQATAVRDVVSGQLWLHIAGQQLPTRLASGNSAGPMDGEQLKLRVLRDTPVLALEALEESDHTDSTDAALRRYLPQQASPTPLLANLGWLHRNSEQFQSLPHSIQQALARLWQAMPQATQLLDPVQLAQALARSGTFMEADLAAANGNVATLLQQDVKAALLALRGQLRSLQLTAHRAALPPGAMPSLRAPLAAMPTGPANLSVLEGVAEQLSELQQQVEGALARINTNQLLHAEAAQQGLMSWLIELPIKREQRTELLRFKFEREPRRNTRNAEVWTVEAALDLGPLGGLHAQLRLSGRRLNVQLRSESPALVQALSQQLLNLKTALQGAGLELDGVVCLHGNPVDSGNRLTRLLDLHA